MIEAVEYACRQASEYAQSAGVFYCSAPETNGWEIATAIGTIGATMVALFFGAVAWRNEKRSESAAEKLRAEQEIQRAAAERRRNQEDQFFQVVSIMRGMVQAFPFGIREDQLWFQTQFRTYLRFVGDDPENSEIQQSAEAILQLFALINFSYSSVTNSSSLGYVGNFWAEERIVEESKGLLMMLSSQFETALKYWHRTGQQSEVADAALVFLHATVQERFDEVEKEFKL